MKVIVTGAAGFIGFWLMRSLARQGIETIGVDNLNDYYPRAYKLARLASVGIELPEAEEGSPDPKLVLTESKQYPTLRFVRMDIADKEAMMRLFDLERPTHVANLAAQAGVRWSLDHPYDYLHSNIEGFLTVLECVRRYPVEHLVYASSSSVYGMNSKVPFAEEDRVEQPESLYAATKRADELMAHVYTRLYGIRATGLRFFTVYGPWGRPDMAPMIFAGSILTGKPIKVYNHGDMRRDFTYISDVVEGLEKVLFGGWHSDGPHIYNIGHGSPVHLMDFISILERTLGKGCRKQLEPMQPGDVPTTYADTTNLERDYGYRATTNLNSGLQEFAAWLKDPKNGEALRHLGIKTEVDGGCNDADVACR